MTTRKQPGPCEVVACVYVYGYLGILLGVYLRIHCGNASSRRLLHVDNLSRKNPDDTHWWASEALNPKPQTVTPSSEILGRP